MPIRTPIISRSLLLTVLAAPLLAGCQASAPPKSENTGPSATQPTPAAAPTPTLAGARVSPATGDGALRVANLRCPVMPEHAIRNGRAIEPLTAEHNGRTIGFCCADCVDLWRSLSPADRDAALALPGVMPASR